MSFSYYNTSNSKNPLNSSGHTYIDVVCNFNRDGKMKPMYFRFENQDQSLTTFKVDNVLSTKELLNCIVFQCEYALDNCKKTINIYYHITEKKWSIKL